MGVLKIFNHILWFLQVLTGIKIDFDIDSLTFRINILHRLHNHISKFKNYGINYNVSNPFSVISYCLHFHVLKIYCHFCAIWINLGKTTSLKRLFSTYTHPFWWCSIRSKNYFSNLNLKTTKIFVYLYNQEVTSKMFLFFFNSERWLAKIYIFMWLGKNHVTLKWPSDREPEFWISEIRWIN